MAENAESKEEDLDDMVIGGNADFKPGQKYPTPAPANGDRVFYESLLDQKPESEMAQEWCLSYGVLPIEKAEKLYKSVCQRKGIKPNQSPATKKTTSSYSSSSSSSSSSAAGSSKTSTTATAKSKKPAKVQIEGDMVMEGHGNSSVWEGQGTSGI